MISSLTTSRATQTSSKSKGKKKIVVDDDEEDEDEEDEEGIVDIEEVRACVHQGWHLCIAEVFNAMLEENKAESLGKGKWTPCSVNKPTAIAGGPVLCKKLQAYIKGLQADLQGDEELSPNDALFATSLDAIAKSNTSMTDLYKACSSMYLEEKKKEALAETGGQVDTPAAAPKSRKRKAGNEDAEGSATPVAKATKKAKKPTTTKPSKFSEHRKKVSSRLIVIQVLVSRLLRSPWTVRRMSQWRVSKSRTLPWLVVILFVVAVVLISICVMTETSVVWQLVGTIPVFVLDMRCFPRPRRVRREQFCRYGFCCLWYMREE